MRFPYFPSSSFFSVTYRDRPDSTIQRFYYQGREAVIALVRRLEDQLEDARSQLVSKPESLIALLRKELQSVKHLLAQKNDGLLRERQLNHQLRRRVHELGHEIESGALRVERDLHNSSLPPSLDLPWKKVKLTPSLRKKSGLSVGGQVGHPGSTLRQVEHPDHLIIHEPEVCQQCNASLEQAQPQNIIRRQVFDIEDGRVKVTEHRTEARSCTQCGTLTRSAFPASVRAPAQYG
jgi:transposase